MNTIYDVVSMHTASTRWKPGIYLHGSKNKFDRFRVDKRVWDGQYGTGRLIYLSDPNDRPGRETQAEAISKGPFGGWLAEVIIKGPTEEFDPLNDVKSRQILEEVLNKINVSPSDAKRMMMGVIPYEYAGIISYNAIKYGFNVFRFYESSVKGFSTAVADPDILEIVRWHKVK